MPTDISNALGTARQFTPQPDAMYQERLNGVSAFQHQTAQGISNADLIAANMQKLTTAMRSYEMAEEKRRDEWGLEVAERAIASKTPEDLIKLDLMDALVTEGGEDVGNNPYALAYAEKYRGENIAAEAKQAYDAEHYDKPAKSVQEEQERFHKWMEQYPEMKGLTEPLNSTAFNKGYYASNSVNQMKLAMDYRQRQKEESLTHLYAGIKADIGSAIEKLPTMPSGEYTEVINKALAKARIMGLDPRPRIELMEYAVYGALEQGHLSKERALQMLESVKVQSHMDGSETKLADVIDPHTVAKVADAYQARFFTEDRYNRIKDYSDDVNMKRYYADAERIADPYEKARFLADASTIASQQDAANRRKAAEREKAALRAFNATAANAYLEANYDAYINNDEWDSFYNKPHIPLIADGKGNGGMRSPTKAEILEFFKSKQASILNRNIQPYKSEETRMSEWMKLFSYEPFREVKQAYIHDYEADIAKLNTASLKRDNDGNVVVSANIETLVSAYKVDPADFLKAFGNSLSKDVARIVRYANTGGSLEAGVEAFAEENSIDPELKTRYQNEVRAQISMSAYTIDDMHTAGGGAMTTTWLNANEHASRQVEEQAARYRAHGYSTDAAVQMALEEVKKQSMYYHSAILPKSLFNGMGTTNDEAWATQVLDEIVYSVADEAGALHDADGVNVVWNSDNSMFTFAYGGTVRYLSLADIRERAYKKAKDAETAGMALPDSSVTADEINTVRDQYVIGVDEDRDTYPDMSFQGGD